MDFVHDDNEKNKPGQLPSLWKELQRLADESGRVREADEARAEFILGELNNALGTEYEMTGNQIQNYQELADAIDTVIEKKKAQIYLDAGEESYRTAIEESMKLEKAQSDLYAEIAENESELIKKREEYAEAAEEVLKGEDLSEYSLARVQSLESEITALETYGEKLKESYESNEALYRDYLEEINRQDTAQVALLEGNTEKALEILQGRSQGIVKQNDLLGKSMEEQNAILYEQFQQADAEFQTTLQRFEEGVAGVTAEMVLNAYKGREEAWIAYEELGKAIPDGAEKGIFSGKDDVDRAVEEVIGGPIETSWKNVDDCVDLGRSMMEGVAQGIRDASGIVETMANRVMAGALVAARSAIEANSPSKKFADLVGAPIPQGIAKGIRDNISALEKTTNWMMGYTFPKANYKIASAIGGMSSGGYSSSSQNTMNATYNMTVNGAPGQDINALSNLIMRKIQSATERKGMIWK